jgi:hypothetical protein
MRLAIEDISLDRWPLSSGEVGAILGIDDKKLRDIRRALKIRYKKSDGILQNEALKIASRLAFEAADHEARAPLMRNIVTHRLGTWVG